jgi:hypothetical protein
VLLDRGDPIDPGDRHAALVHHAARLRGVGLGAKAIRTALEELQERFTEPTGRRGEIDGIVQWVMERPAPPPLDPVDIELLGLLGELPPTPSRRNAATAKPTSGRRQDAPLIMSLVEFLGGSEDDAAWLVDHLAPKGALVVIAGLPKVGKSTFVYGMLGALTCD